MTARARRPRRANRGRKAPAHLAPTLLGVVLAIVLFGMAPLVLIAVVGISQGTLPPDGVLGAADGYPLFQPPFWLLWLPATAMLVLGVTTWRLPERFPQFFWGARFDMSVLSLVGAVTTFTAAVAYGAPQFTVVIWATVPWVLAVILFAIRGVLGFASDAAEALRPTRAEPHPEPAHDTSGGGAP